jgi:hypothetical protein
VLGAQVDRAAVDDDVALVVDGIAPGRERELDVRQRVGGGDVGDMDQLVVRRPELALPR